MTIVKVSPIDKTIPKEIRDKIKKGSTVYRLIRLARKTTTTRHITGTASGQLIESRHATIKYNIADTSREDLNHIERFISDDGWGVTSTSVQVEERR